MCNNDDSEYNDILIRQLRDLKLEVSNLRKILINDTDMWLTVNLQKLDRYYGKKEFPVKKLIKDVVVFGLNYTLGPLETVYMFSQHILGNKGVFSHYVNLHCPEIGKKKDKLRKEINTINLNSDVNGIIKVLHGIVDHHQTLIHTIPKTHIEKFIKSVYI